MPIYEYACLDCRKRVSVFFRSFAVAGDDAARCPLCNGANLRRLVSKVAVLKSEESRMDDLADSSLMSGLESEDPRALASFMRRMSKEMGEPLDDEMSEVINRLEKGESPEAIDEALGEGGLSGGALDDDYSSFPDAGFGPAPSA